MQGPDTHLAKGRGELMCVGYQSVYNFISVYCANLSLCLSACVHKFVCMWLCVFVCLRD